MTPRSSLIWESRGAFFLIRGTKHADTPDKTSYYGIKNYFHGLKIYNQALKIYNQAMKIYFQAMRIILEGELKCFIRRVKMFYKAS